MGLLIDEGQNFLGAALRVVIDHHMVIPDPLVHLPFGPLHADGDLVLRGVVPAPEPPLQLLTEGGMMNTSTASG